MSLEILKVIFWVSRPLGWLVIPIPYLLGIIASGAELGLVVLAQALSLSFPLCLTGYGLNDIYDYESDSKNPRKGKFHGAILKPGHHSTVKKSSILAALLVIAVAVLTMNLYNMALVGILVLLVIAYSVPPARIKDKPPLDSIVNGFMYFFLPLAMGFSLGLPLSEINVIFYAATLYFIGAHAFSTVMDYEADRNSGIRTFAVAFGKRAAAYFGTLASGTALLIAISLAAIDFSFGMLIISFFFSFSLVVIFCVSFRPTEVLAIKGFKLIFAMGVVASFIYLVVKYQIFFFLI
jgi:4-hydroxybenzoate polyprenyltransferase